MESKGLSDTKIKKEPTQRPKKRYKKQKTEALYIPGFSSIYDEAHALALKDYERFSTEALRKALSVQRKLAGRHPTVVQKATMDAIIKIGKSRG